jgi:predicted Ser/Thr protein kinase
MGEIFRATDDVLGRAVAIKILAERHAKDEATRRRFTREALAAARLSGEPNTVTIYDVGEWNERPFIVMEYLGGGSLASRLREEGAQPAATALRWLEQAASALDAAHAQGIVHRDVKPANLLLDRDGNVHVADFGIASAAGLDSLTATGTVLGTAGYLAPEQAQGERASAESDEYALAVVAFELLTGHRPFENESLTAEAAAHVHAPIPSPCERKHDLPCELDPVFERAMSKRREERYPSGRDFVAALHEAFDRAAGATGELRPTAAAPPPGPVPIGARPVRRGGGRWLLVAALLALGAIVGAVVAIALTSGGGSGKKTSATTVAARSTTAVASTAAAGNPIALTDRSTQLERDGRYAEALPLAQQALEQLRGSGQIYEAYANFDVGHALANLGRCKEALKYLHASEKIQGHRAEIDADRARCRGKA